MKYQIVKNADKKTVTVVISPVEFFYVDKLYEHQASDKPYFWANGVLNGADFKNDITPFMNEFLAALNEVSASKLPNTEKIVGKDVFSMEEGDFKLITKHLDQDNNWNGTFKMSLMNKNKNTDKRFLFANFQNPQPIPKEDGWKYFYAIEIEVSATYDEDELEKKVFCLFHRAFAIEEKASTYSQNDSAWNGFDFGQGDSINVGSQGGQSKQKEDPFSDASSIEIGDDELPF